ncbi:MULTISPECIES: excinuclease ABC subunit UvrA [Candidatus Ichthyocystis]|uniref:UvrABC system protein A n=1 Tax=Candidatus Ichthyocystis hellenicum TaxID=1561003 RepID=A0A0S4M178_9BURK|nr:MULTISPECIES: excinuclease ABC subunit UvrA [Ichthyocystis]CUT16992.1 Excinuclease ABC subunit A [Candidatus Ichthyocystis hellenicum]
MVKSPHDNIIIRGAKTHNLQNIDVVIPKNKLVVITGPSGSGKSSLAFDTLFAEGHRRYVESLSTYARQFLGVMDKPDVISISGLLPAVAIEQRTYSGSPRSTVGTITEIYDYLRLLYARVGIPQCPTHGMDLSSYSLTQIVDDIICTHTEEKLFVLAPCKILPGIHIQEALQKLIQQGFIRFIADNVIYYEEEISKLTKIKSSLFVVVDRIIVRNNCQERLTDSIETAIRIGSNKISCFYPELNLYQNYSTQYHCPLCDYSIPPPAPALFSFNSPHGACPGCRGLGHQSDWSIEKIVTYPQLSIKNGAIPLISKSYPEQLGKMIEVINHYQIPTDQSFQNLQESVRHTLLDGNDNYPGYQGFLNFLTNRYCQAQNASHREKEELQKYRVTISCRSCQGDKINNQAKTIKINNFPINKVMKMSLLENKTWLSNLSITGYRKEVANKIIAEIQKRLQFLIDVGVGYLTLERPTDSLSGGEAQRIRLASQIGSGLTGVLYVLDEPSIGLHQKDNELLLKTLTRLRDIGNSVVVVEHDEDAIRSADHIIDMGPLAGSDGGKIVAEGSIEDILSSPSLTGKYLSRSITMPQPEIRKRPRTNRKVILKGASGNNLKKVNVHIPVGLLVCVTGISGSGKSTLINDTLYPAVAQYLKLKTNTPSPYDSIIGAAFFDKTIVIDQHSIGRSSRSNLASYMGILPIIRELLASTSLARQRAYTPGRFSSNNKGGRCEHCTGEGQIKVEMLFLPNMFIPCNVCNGKRFSRETLEIFYKEKNITDILNMTVDETATFFESHPSIQKKISILKDVGLGYMPLGQQAQTLSGGEAQKIKLAQEMSRTQTGKTLYLLDEPTTGLHFHDIHKLLNILLHLRDKDNTVVVIEHNINVIKAADWVIDMGPGGGNDGGKIIATGTPEQIAENKDSATGHYLKQALSQNKTSHHGSNASDKKTN